MGHSWPVIATLLLLLSSSLAAQIDELFTVCEAQSDIPVQKPVTQQCHQQKCVLKARFSGYKYLMKAWEYVAVIKGAPSDLYYKGLDNI